MNKKVTQMFMCPFNSCYRIISVVIYSFLQIIGVIFIGVGSYVVHKGNGSDYDELLGFLGETDDSKNPTPAEDMLIDALAVKNALLAVGGFLITIGLATFFISTCGWLGACKQNTCLLFTVMSKVTSHMSLPHLPALCEVLVTSLQNRYMYSYFP